MLRLNLINIVSIAVIALATYVIVFGGLRAAGVTVPYVNS